MNPVIACDLDFGLYLCSLLLHDKYVGKIYKFNK